MARWPHTDELTRILWLYHTYMSWQFNWLMMDSLYPPPPKITNKNWSMGWLFRALLLLIAAQICILEANRYWHCQGIGHMHMKFLPIRLTHDHSGQSCSLACRSAPYDDWVFSGEQYTEQYYGQLWPNFYGVINYDQVHVLWASSYSQMGKNLCKKSKLMGMYQGTHTEKNLSSMISY